jgi:hypothetical protein
VSSNEEIAAEHLRRRWLKPDWQRWMREDVDRWMPPIVEAKGVQAAPAADAEFAAELRRLQAQQDSLRHMLAGVTFELALRRLRRKYNPDQPRVPAGNGRESGRWTDVGGSGAPKRDQSERSNTARSTDFSAIRRRGTPFVGATPGQQFRLDQAIGRTENALAQIRQYDPNWRPREVTLTSLDSAEGAIAVVEARAAEAETRLNELRSGIGANFGPPLEMQNPRTGPPPSSSSILDAPAWIHVYRVANNMPDLFGQPSWALDKGTVAVAKIDGTVVFGVNSGAPGYSSVDRVNAEAWRATLVDRYPSVMDTSNIGRRPNDSVYHAEATAVIRAAQERGGTLAGLSFEVHTDRVLCSSCEAVLPKLGLELGNPTVTFFEIPTGKIWIMRDGSWISGARR